METHLKNLGRTIVHRPTYNISLTCARLCYKLRDYLSILYKHLITVTVLENLFEIVDIQSYNGFINSTENHMENGGIVYENVFRQREYLLEFRQQLVTLYHLNPT